MFSSIFHLFNFINIIIFNTNIKMKNIVTTLLLGTAVNATNLRNLAAGEWIPDICADEGVECAL